MGVGDNVGEWRLGDCACDDVRVSKSVSVLISECVRVNWRK
jgi:hypothetical protein